MKNKRIIIILTVIVALLLIPLIAMQFTDEVNWTFADFAVMGILLLFTAFFFELVMRIVSKARHRIFLVVALLLVFFLIWVELAVGIFGTPFAGS